MWLIFVVIIILVFIIAVIAEALGYDITTKPHFHNQNHRREQDELLNRWLSGNRQPNDEERMFEEIYEGDVDDPIWE